MAEELVCVTGATGFVASELVKQLLAGGYRVRGTVRNPAKAASVAHLKALEGAADRLELVQADLLEDGSFDAAVAGCVGVFHTASPFFYDTEDGEADLVQPALKGTTNVLASCLKHAATIRRVVVTSSVGFHMGVHCCAKMHGIPPIAAVAPFCGRKPGEPYTEDHWADATQLRERKLWYPLSKTVAERAVWDFANAHPESFSLCTVNPCMIIGPQLQPSVNTSTDYILAWVNGSKSSIPNSSMFWVDVRDVARAHILVYEKPEASGRHLCIGDALLWKDACAILRELYPTRAVPTEEDPLKEGEPPAELGLWSDAKLAALGLERPIQFRDSVKDTVDSAMARGFLV